MAKKSQLKSSAKQIESLTHNEAKRKNIPTAEYQSVIQKEEEKPKTIKYPRNTDLDPQLVWRGKDEQDWSDLVVHAPPLYIQEKVQPKVLIDDLLRQTREQRDQESGAQTDLFADFNGIPAGVDKTEFYQHDQNWSNRMILGDSLQVMASLAEREGLRGKVQCIYIDPPYGIKFNSNFQWSTTSRDVKDGNAGHITREPEQVKAFRDTWRDGIHSYLTYLRDRLTVARDLLTESGSLFVQMGDENMHIVRSLLDEVFGKDNSVSLINFQTTSSLGGDYLSKSCDYVLWYSKSFSSVKFRQVLRNRGLEHDVGNRFTRIELEPVFRRVMTGAERNDPANIPNGARVYRHGPLTSQSGSEKSQFAVELDGQVFRPGAGQYWKTTEPGLVRLRRAARLAAPSKNSLAYVRFMDDFPCRTFTNVWTDTQTGAFTESKVYVVQTNTKVIERCILMATDPGDLVLDPTCGSGTTATVAEQWGRRWITIDTSRVALALARARIMGARYAFYLLADSREGQLKEAEVTRTAPSSQPVHGNIRQGFVYERVPHITLKSIANNAEIDVIWDKWEQRLAPLRGQLSVASGQKKTLEEWEIPREPPKNWPPATQPLFTEFWQARIARQKEIDASIAAKAEFEYLYDKPYADNKKVRVAGPFTVESLSPHRVLGVDDNDELIDTLKEDSAEYGVKQSFAQMILENLKTAGVQQAHKEDKITFTSLTAWPGELVCGEGRFEASGQWLVNSGQRKQDSSTSHNPLSTDSRTELRAGIFIGPEFGTV
ncbi:MAG: site-specific DNA-methyltransferase, partial [Candidatus Binatia bacterium]|nr:site-specific DNA-methyltransferase [Candidatus Binatia bacterium]